MYISKWVRTYNYIEDYFKTVYELYAGAYIASYPVMYYSLDMEKSVYDDMLNLGSYEKLGVGSLSGMKWKKIYYLPVFAIEQVRPDLVPSERGVLMSELTTRLVLPSNYGIKPIEGDAVDLSFGYLSPLTKVKMLYVVSSISLAHQCDHYQLYQLGLKDAPFNVDKIDKQVSEHLLFYDLDKRIIPLSSGIELMKIVSKIENLIRNINDSCFDKKCTVFLQRR